MNQSARNPFFYMHTPQPVKKEGEKETAVYTAIFDRSACIGVERIAHS